MILGADGNKLLILRPTPPLHKDVDLPAQHVDCVQVSNCCMSQIINNETGKLHEKYLIPVRSPQVCYYPLRSGLKSKII